MCLASVRLDYNKPLHYVIIAWRLFLWRVFLFGVLACSCYNRPGRCKYCKVCRYKKHDIKNNQCGGVWASVIALY